MVEVSLTEWAVQVWTSRSLYQYFLSSIVISYLAGKIEEKVNAPYPRTYQDIVTQDFCVYLKDLNSVTWLYLAE